MRDIAWGIGFTLLVGGAVMLSAGVAPPNIAATLTMVGAVLCFAVTFPRGE